MHQTHTSFMAQRNGDPLPLEDVAIEATLRDLIATVEVRQTYRNDEKTNVEVVYTFPLPLDAALLDLEVTIGERLLRGSVVAKPEAEERYEDAIAEGDAALMLEHAEPGLYTASVGNVMPGERITVRFRYGMALRWSGNAVRFFLPTTVAPRYGVASLAAYMVPETALTVENRFGLTVRVEGLLRPARIECPSHEVSYHLTDDAAEIALASDRAVMDRDFVLMLNAPEGDRSYALADHDPAGEVVLVSFQPKLGGGAGQEPRSVKIVVDCSGSMAGDSIEQAKQALLAILDLLRPADRLNVIAFGSDAKALFKQQEPCTPAKLERARRFCAALDANLGGTEIGHALERAYASVTASEMPEDVLLITDGEVGPWQEVVERAIASRHRLFTVGVGSSVAEPFVRALADRTGGACELVSPNEDMAGRITRHFQRMSATRSAGARVVWPDGAVERWPTALRHVFEGDTVIAWARYAERPEGEVIFELEAGSGRTIRQAAQIRGAAHGDAATSTLARLAAAMRLPELDAALGSAEAVAYQLVSRWTNYFVVHERPEAEKAAHLPELRKVRQTLAAGWGGSGVVASMAPQGSVRPRSFPEVCADVSIMEAPVPYGEGASSSQGIPPYARIPMEQWEAELRGLVNGLNAAPERIRAGMTVEDLGALGVPVDMLDQIRDDTSAGMPEFVAVLHFLSLIAQSPVGDGLTKEVKRAIRTALRRGSPKRGA